MAELAVNHDAATSDLRPGHTVALGLLAAAQVGFTAAFTPIGTRSGDWRVAGLPDPDSLVFAASGFILAHLLTLYPIWAALGAGDVLRRYATTFLLCLAFFGAVAVRGMYRGHRDPLAPPFIFFIAGFSLMTLVFWSVRRWGRWRLAIPGAPPMSSSQSAQPLVFRLSHIQFRLRHLFECTALAAALLALYRLYFPDGFPVRLFAGWGLHFSRMIRDIPFVVLLLLPATAVPRIVLAFNRNRLNLLRSASAAAVCWAGFDYGLICLGGVFHQATWPVVVSVQLGASAAGLVSAIVLRACGYRIFRVDKQR